MRVCAADGHVGDVGAGVAGLQKSAVDKNRPGTDSILAVQKKRIISRPLRVIDLFVLTLLSTQ